jgi:hypothetical protein
MIENLKIRGGLSFLLIVMIFATAACNSSDTAIKVLPSSSAAADGVSMKLTPTSLTTLPPANSATPSWTIRPTAEPSLAPTQTATELPAITQTQTPFQTSTPTTTATYAILRGTVLEQANCRYGPGAAYLYKYGLLKDNNVELIGRNELGTWIVIQAIGGNNPCWVKALLMDIKGEVMSLAPTTLPLPQSPYYGPVTGVSAVRRGDSVIISWNPINLRAGDDSEQYPYLIEAWLCQNGKLTFKPIGSWETIVTVQDEHGCSEASHARVYGVEKHGYTAWVTIPWPPP